MPGWIFPYTGSGDGALDPEGCVGLWTACEGADPPQGYRSERVREILGVVTLAWTSNGTPRVACPLHLGTIWSRSCSPLPRQTSRGTHVLF